MLKNLFAFFEFSTKRLPNTGLRPTTWPETKPTSPGLQISRRIPWVSVSASLALLCLCVPAFAAATITAISPASAYPGETVKVTFTGTGLSGTTGVNGFGSNIKVSNVVASSTTVTATFTISTSAPAQGHSVSLATSGGNTNSLVFRILPPTVASISPASGGLGSTVNVTFTGHGLSGTSAVSGFGSKVQVSNLVATDTAVKATFTIAQTAAVQNHTLTLTTPDGATNAVAFQVTGGGTPTLGLSANSINFGNEAIRVTGSETLTLTSTGTAAVTISSASISGTGFSMSGATFPVTLNPGIAIKIQVSFTPPAAGTDTGSIKFTSNSSTGSTSSVALSGTGIHQVKLSWAAPTNSSDPAVGYYVYRETAGASSYQLLTSSAVPQTAYYDWTVQSGSSYTYYVKSVDAGGKTSVPSSTVSVAIP